MSEVAQQKEALTTNEAYGLFEPAVLRNMAATAIAPSIRFAWLEITGQCQLKCGHCYAESGPKGTHGTMTDEAWMGTMDELAGLGTETVQFIGGEPTMHPSLSNLIDHALDRDMQVEVYSNLAHVNERQQIAFSQPGVSLATSYYSSKPEQHEVITKNPGSYNRTKANILWAAQHNLPLRVGIIDILENQNIDGARQELIELGVPESRIGIDRKRGVGRGAGEQEPGIGELCGNCVNDVIAILPNGDVQPCVFSRWEALTVGNVQDMALTDILQSERFTEVRSLLVANFATSALERCRPPCEPDNGCGPISCNPCAPAIATCKPRKD